jgi:hypothetical protein
MLVALNWGKQFLHTSSAQMYLFHQILDHSVFYWKNISNLKSWKQIKSYQRSESGGVALTCDTKARNDDVMINYVTLTLKRYFYENPRTRTNIVNFGIGNAVMSSGGRTSNLLLSQTFFFEGWKSTEVAITAGVEHKQPISFNFFRFNWAVIYFIYWLSTSSGI